MHGVNFDFPARRGSGGYGPAAAPRRISPLERFALSGALLIYSPFPPEGKTLVAMAAFVLFGLALSLRRVIRQRGGGAIRPWFAPAAPALAGLAWAAWVGLASAPREPCGVCSGGPCSAAFGRMLEDSRVDASGETVYALALESVVRDAGTAPASGAVRVWISGGPETRIGERVILRSPRFERGRARAAGLGSAGYAPDPLSAALRARAAAYDALVGAIDRIGGRSNAFLKALLLGFRDELDPGTAALFRASGCLHVLALSGQHLAVVAGAAAALLGTILPKRRASALACAFALAYAMVTGLAPSIARAAVMYAYAALAQALGRKPSKAASLCASFALHASLSPESALSASFALSYGAVAGMALCSDAISFAIAPWVPVRLRPDAAASLGAQAFGSGYSLCALGSYAPVGFAASIACAKPVEWFMYVGMASLPLVALCPGLSGACALALDALFRAIEAILGVFAAFPTLTLPPTARSPVGTAYWIVVVAFGALVYARRHGRFSRGRGGPAPSDGR